MSNKTMAPTAQNQGEAYHVVVVVLVVLEEELPPPASPPDAGASCEIHNKTNRFATSKQLQAFHPFGMLNRFMIYFFK